MKRVEKKFVKIDWKNAQFELVEGKLMVVELDKDGNIVEETIFMDAIEDLMNQPGLTISIKKENDLAE